MFKFADALALRGMKNVGEGGGVRVRLRTDLPVTCVLARKNCDVAARLGVVDGPRQSRLDNMTVLGTGPGRWLFIGRAPKDLVDLLAGIASLSDLSDGYALFEVWGEKVREVLSKGIPIDLNGDAFSSDVGVTVVAHMGAVIWRNEQDRFSIAVFRSYTGSFWHWLSASAVASGLIVEDA